MERDSYIRIRIGCDNSHQICFKAMAALECGHGYFCQQYASCYEIIKRKMMDEKRGKSEYIQTCVSPSVETL